MMAGPEDREQRVHAHAVHLLAQAREELNKADTKAQVLLGVVGIGVSAVAGGLLAGSWSPFELSPWVQWGWWLGAVAALASLVCLAGAVYPRTARLPGAPPRGIAYFADVERYATAEAVAVVLREPANLDLLRLAEQIKQISSIVVRKYRLIKWGFWLLLAAIVCCLVPVVVQLML
ncbi:Pycsar system effector family protein [Nonomuraea sp. NPDC050556]|uniref:Pycsar system effector family protein n=1 Tax=Nonomuraea sp. NPDC050556 TaxID=3364369 RepID=UPI00379A528D